MTDQDEGPSPTAEMAVVKRKGCVLALVDRVFANWWKLAAVALVAWLIWSGKTPEWVLDQVARFWDKVAR